MLTLKNLSLTASDAQGRTDIVKNVSLDVEDGKFLVITGPNGGGKTTLAKLIMGIEEPTSGLDYRECMTVMETVRTMAERGCAVIMVCHDMEVVSDFAERIVVMADGRILDRGRTHELFSNIDLMRRAYVEPPQGIELSRRLGSSVSPAFAQVSEVTDVVRITKEMVHRG